MFNGKNCDSKEINNMDVPSHLKINFLMMKKLTLFLVLSLAVCSLNASNLAENPNSVKTKSTISGIVYDKLTGEPLAGVEVKLMNSDVKTYTDFEGRFEIKEIQPGAHAVAINYISYQDIVENIYTEAGNNTNMMVKLNSVEK
jgi:hypothetical protein